MTTTKAKPWELLKDEFTRYKSAKKVSDSKKKEGYETRILCRPSGKFQVKIRKHDD
jgi:hypothetical protein